MSLDKYQIAKCIARELRDGYYVYLGIGSQLSSQTTSLPE